MGNLIFSIFVKNCFRFLFTLETNCVTPCRTARWRRDFGRDGQVFIITMFIIIMFIITVVVITIRQGDSHTLTKVKCCHWTTTEYVCNQIDKNSKTKSKIFYSCIPTFICRRPLSHTHSNPCRYRRYIRSNSRGYLRISPQTQLTLHLTSSSHLTPVRPIHMCWLWMINLLNAHW